MTYLQKCRAVKPPTSSLISDGGFLEGLFIHFVLVSVLYFNIHFVLIYLAIRIGLLVGKLMHAITASTSTLERGVPSPA